MKHIKYPKETIEKAQSMFEQGYSFPKIAKALGIKRWMTVFDWSKKFQWTKLADPSTISPIASTKLLEIFEHVISFTDLIITDLETKLQSSQLSIQDITKVMEKLPPLIKNLKTSEICTPKLLDTLSALQSPTQELKDKKDKILTFLNLIDPEKT